MYSSPLVAFFTIVIVVGMAFTFLFFYVKSKLHDIHKTWHLLLEKLNHRLDKIPTILETMRKYTQDQEKLIQEIIDLRAKSRPMEKIDAEKVQLELDISEKLREVWKLGEKMPELQRDTNFLAFKIELKALETEIEKFLEQYNQKVRSYNKWLQFIPLRLILLIFRFPKISIFEFESGTF